MESLVRCGFVPGFHGGFPTKFQEFTLKLTARTWITGERYNLTSWRINSLNVKMDGLGVMIFFFLFQGCFFLRWKCHSSGGFHVRDESLHSLKLAARTWITGVFQDVGLAFGARPLGGTVYIPIFLGDGIKLDANLWQFWGISLFFLCHCLDWQSYDKIVPSDFVVGEVGPLLEIWWNMHV